ncbi:MAG TPA: hypothetical protein VMR34_01220 [Candidatus Saccharimonadales bacterium]|nr:hypothetical protein [Candidatus Saccharimonadales bacterium]
MKKKKATHKVRSRRFLVAPVKKHTRNAKVRALVKKQVKRKRTIHKRILLSPLVVFVWLCLAVFILGWTFRVLADSITITAVVPAVPLEEGATITSPINGANLTQTPIEVSGYCPNNSYINLYNNGVFAGTALCQSGVFQIEVDLFTGDNILIAQDYNFTDQAGPTTPSVQVTYKQSTNGTTQSSAPSSSTTTPNSVNVPKVLPLLLTSSFHYQTFAIGSPFSWQLDLQGGNPPFKVMINWGDGKTTNMTFNSDSVFTITHSYIEAGYFPIRVFATDSEGGHYMMQLSALIRSPGSAGILNSTGGPITGSTINNTPSTGVEGFLVDSKNWLWLAWPTLIIVTLMMVGFWLGELQERRYLLSKKVAIKQR